MKKILFLLAIALLYLTSCSQDDADSESKSGFAPSSLNVDDLFRNVDRGDENAYDAVRIKSGTEALVQYSRDIAGYTLRTPYLYKQTEDNTANLQIVVQQYINGPIRNRKFERTGKLIFTDKERCTFKYTEKYWADGVLQHSIENSEKWIYIQAK